MEDLNLKARRILESIYNNGGEATSSEIKELTGIERSATVKYHAQQILEDTGLVTSEKVETPEHPAKIYQYEITEEGENQIAHLFEDGEDIPIKHRMEDIENRFRETEEHVSELVGAVEEIKAETEGHSQTAERAIEIAEDTRDIFDVLRDDVTKKIESNEADINALNRELSEVSDKLDKVRELEYKVEDLETRLDQHEGEVDPPDLDAVSVNGGVVEEADNEAEEEESTRLDKVIRYIENIDHEEHGIEGSRTLREHLKETFPSLSEEDIDIVTQRVRFVA